MKNSKLLLALSGLVTLMLHVDATLGATAGYVQFVNGQVSLTTARGATHTLQKGEAINEGDTVSTKQSSSAQIKMQDGGFIAVRPDTQLKFDSFKFTGQAGKPESSFFSLFRGGFRAVTGLIGRINRQDYRITTPAATIGVRGTDHETVYLPTPTPGAQAGAYSKVNIGETSLTTNKGTINVLPNQMGFAGGLNQPPQLQPINTSIFTVATAPTKTIKESKKEERKENGKPEGASQKQQSASEAQDEKSSGAAEPIRDTAVVDNTKLAKNITTTVTTTAATESKTDAAITTTVAPKTELAVIAKSGGLTLNATEQTVTSGGTTVSVQDGIYSVQAKTAADAAQVAADAANSAKIAATNANTTLQVIALADTAPAAAAIATANSNISTATSLVTTALALPAVSAGTAPTTAQNNATTAASQTTAANAAFTANGSFADSTAAPAKTATQTANTALQSANTALQSAATTVSTQNTSLSTAKTAANTAWASANSNLATANSAFSTAGTQNTSITSAQTAATSLLSAAQTAANAAQTAATAAQAAAAQAEALQAAGDLTGAAEHLAIAQNQLAIAQTQRANAQAAQSSLATQLASAQAAKTTASTAVANATSAATVAANAATTAQTQAANASTAATAANTALATVTSQSALVNTNAATVAANAPIAAYNNPAVVTADRFIGVLGSVVTPTAGQHIEGGGPGAAFTGVGTANTSFVLDGSGNLVESRHTWYEESPASTATTQVVVPDANVKRTGGTAAETFKLSDSSIYGGRWTGGSITVTDNASAVSPITRNFGATSEHWAIMLAPTFGYVQALTGTTAYTKAAATSPTDALGNVGVLNTATLSANFTSQLVSAALNLTISGKTFDVQALNLAINGFGFSSAGAISPTCTGCSTTYYAHVGGMFAGNAAASAGVSYTLWAGALPGATTGATDLIQGGVAFSTATPPTLQAFDVAAQTAATAAATAATAAQTAATAATAANTTLTGIATVSTAPATTAISTATTNIGTATTSVSTATALTPANATTAANNATAATAAATSAAAQAAAAQAALTSNGAFADSTATTANTSVQSANTAVQTASTTVQTNATAVTTQNNALNTAQTAATTALDTANTSLTTANSTVGTVTGFNSTITSAQSAAATPLSTAQAAATAAQTAATAAQAAATQAAALQAGGDLIGAQAQLVIAQQQLAIAQSEQSNAIAAQNAVGTQLAAAQAAQTAANTAVTDAANIANSAEAFAVAAQTQAAAANTALAAANTALTTTTNQLAVVNTNAVTVAANAPIAAYNNPAVVSNNFTGHLSMPVPAATSGFDIASEDTTTLKANTTYVLDGNGNLVEMRSTTFNIMPVQSTATTTIANADVKWSGGTAADTFKLPDNSIYGGRWENATLTVTDLSNSAITTYTPASSLWAVLLTPNVGYVQSLVGTTSYNLAGATAPFDTAGNVGTLISASLVADFTSQLVNAAINLTMPAASSMAGTYDISANGMQINSVVSGAGYGGFGGNNIPTVSCTGTCAANVVGGYSADVGGSFAGAGAASAGLGYDLWPTVSVGSPVTDLVQGLVAFTATPPTGPTNPAAGTWSSFGHMLLGSTGPGWERGRFNDGGQFALPETNFILDGTGNLVRSLHADYNERYVSGTSSSANHYTDAMVTYSGGIASDHYTVGDVAIGRWTGGQMTVVDNNSILPTTVNNLGVTSSYWFMTRAEPWEYVQSLIGTTSYTQAGATLPTDSFGNVGTLPVATLSANFTSQTVDASVAFTIANQGLTIANPAIPIVVGTSIFEGTIEFNNAPTVSCTGTGCSGGYLGWLTGGFAGATASSATLAYKVWPTALPDSLVSDLIQGVVAFNTGTAPTAGTNPPAGNWESFSHLLVGTTGAWQRGRFNPGSNPPQSEASFILDGAGNLVRSMHVNYNERVVWRNVATATNGYGDAMVSYSGGVASDRYITPDNNLIIGRWTGGQLTVTDNLGIQSDLVKNLGVTSAYWGITSPSPVNYVPSLIGTTTYTQGGATLPTNSFGNVGTMPVATLAANFTAQTVDASVAFTIASQNLNISNPAIPIVAGANYFDAMLELGTEPTVSCSGVGCSGGGYQGFMTGSFAGAQATSVDLSYKAWPTAVADSLVTDIIQGVVAFYTNTPPTVSPYVAVEVAGSGAWFDGLASPADLFYVAGGTSANGALQSITMRDIGGGGNWVGTSSLSGGGATSANAPGFAATGIQYGAWSGYTGESNSWSASLGGMKSAPSAWMYGPSGYLDAAYQGTTSLNGAMASTFTYQLDGATAPTSRNSGLTGVVTGATVTADFVNMLVSATLDLTMPGNENWGASITDQPISLAMGALQAQPVVTYGLGVAPTTCTTCSGNLDASFTGQNLAGIIAGYELWNDAQTGGGNVSGIVALTRNFTGNTNPAVADDGATAPTGNIEVATTGEGNGGFIQSASSYTTTGNLLTAFGSSGAGFSNQTTITCTTCTTTPTGQVATSGIYYGTWEAGTYAQSYSSTFTAGTMPPSYWITGPEAGPLFLPQALTGTATYAFDAGQVSNFNGVPGTVTGTTALTLDFNKQAVGINLDFSVIDTAATVHNWQVYTAAGDEAPLGQGNGMSSAGFRAGNYGGGDSGLLTVSVDGGATTVDYLNASVNGQLTGAGLDGAIMSFDINGVLNQATAPSYENISGVAAFTGTAQAVNTSHRYVGASFYDPFAAVPQPMFGLYANNDTRVLQDVAGLAGNLTQFDTQLMDGGGASMTFARNSSTLANQGSDPVTGISWGRWDGGTFNATDRISASVTPVTQAGSLHWIAESAATSATTLPVTGTYTYVNAGGTTPTDNAGILGTLNTATLSADFTNKTVNLGVNVTVNGATLDAVGANVPIIQKTVFFASSQEPAASTSHLNVTCTGGAACGTTLGGTVLGKFTGAGAIGAAMTYGLQNGSSVVSGVTAFHQ